MKIKNKLLLLVVFIALALPLIYSGTASAIYTDDGLVPSGNALTNWNIRDTGTCVEAVTSAGAVTTGAQASLADCIATIYPEATQATCTSFTNTDAGAPGAHYWTSTCVKVPGVSAYSLTGLDRTPQNCALKGGTWESACTASWKYINPPGGASVKTDTTGQGFCYTTVDLTTVPGLYTSKAACLTNVGAPGLSASGYSWSTSLPTNACTYKYGIEGYIAKAVTSLDGLTVIPAETHENLTAYTYGQCVAAGFSWINGSVSSKTTPAPTVVVADPNGTQITTALYGIQGCSECHNSLSQDLPYSYFWKGDTYAYTGHKNMLRKVVAGSAWGGPTAAGTMAAYTADTSGNINFAAPSVTIGATSYPLLYIFGDWISFAPSGLDAILQVGSAGKENGGGSDYSCAQCHTTGWSTGINSPVTAPTGICNYTSQTTQAACTTYVPAGITGWGTGIWTVKAGVQGASYAPPQPNGTNPAYPAETPGITFGGAGSWDQDGIICSRCHAGVFVNGSSNTTSYADEYITGSTSSSMGNVPKVTVNEQVNNVCFGCHGDAFVKTSPSTLPGQAGTGPDVDLNNPTVPSITVTATSTTFGSHYLGEAFLNSPHARFSGSMSQNVTGTYVVNNNVPASYNSAFKGYTCEDSSSGASDRYSTYWNGTSNQPITTLEQCNLANGKGTLATPDPTSYGYWQQESQGACTTCHDIHNTLVLNNYEANAIKIECQTCHSDTTGLGGTGYATAPGFSKIQVNLAMIGHPKGSNTPFDATRFANPCVTCHMPPTASGADPMHFFRINNSATYTTFPSLTAYNSGWKLPTTASDTHAASGIAYNNAVWTDLGFACGQCHYTTGLEYVSGNPVFDVNTLSTYATGIHNNSTIIPSFSLTYGGTNLTASVSGSAICGTGATCSAFTYTWTWGDGATTAGQTTTHAYTTAGTYTITLTVTDTNGNSGQKAEKFIAVGVTAAPVASFSTPCASALAGMTATLTDSSTNVGPGGVVKVYWGDGLSELQSFPISTAFTHTYFNPGTYTITQQAINAAGLDSAFNQCVVSVGTSVASTLTGTVENLATTPLVGATVQAQMVGSAMKLTVYTNGSGAFSLPLVSGSTYNIYVTAPGYIFSVPAATVTVPHAALLIQSSN